MEFAGDELDDNNGTEMLVDLGGLWHVKHLGPRAQICATYINEFTCVSTLTATWDYSSLLLSYLQLY